MAPYTVTGVPPSAAPRSGHTDDTDADATYVKPTPPELNCCAFIDTSTRRDPPPLCAGVAHSSWLPSTYRATTTLLLSSKRQRSVADARKCAPSSVRRVPPSTGPSSGATALTHIRAW